MASSNERITNRRLLIFLAFMLVLSYAMPTLFGLKPPRLTPKDALTPLQLKELEAKELRDEITTLEDRLAVLIARNQLAEKAQNLALAKTKEAEEAFAAAEADALAANEAFDVADLKEKEAKQALRYARMTEVQARDALREANEKEKVAQRALATARKLQDEANKALANAQNQSKLAATTLEDIRILEEKIAELNADITKQDEGAKREDADDVPQEQASLTRQLPKAGMPVLVFEDGVVPRHNKLKIPSDIDQLTVKERKKEFITLLLPLIIQANDIISDRRTALQEAIRDGDDGKIAQFAKLYGLANFDGDSSALEDELLSRIAPIPTSLALAQAAVESGWGQSRFAKEGNALFGQWAWRAEQGIKPLDASNSRAVIRSFATIYDSVFAYMHNLNTHYAYQDLRTVRAQELEQSDRVSGIKLARYLTAYAELGEKYVYVLQSMILQNRFDIYETYQVAPQS